MSYLTPVAYLFAEYCCSPPDRSQSHTFYFRKDGYQDDSFVITSGTNGWVLGNILLGGLIGGVVDFASGGARKLSHDSVHVTLAPLSARQATPAPAALVISPAPPPTQGVPAVSVTPVPVAAPLLLRPPVPSRSCTTPPRR